MDRDTKITVSINDLKDILYRKYRIDGDGECGCYCNGRWLSVDDVISALADELL